mmetsp:Transcript_125878/g.218124  ORF Transcript_125878/g.218124 Transcript_125878/m.218124 type:complete len:644 (-) Transcript_125878:143-2074(-)
MLQIPYELASLLLGAACYMLKKVSMPQPAAKKAAAEEEDVQAADCSTECTSWNAGCAEPDSEPSPGSEEHVVVQHAEVPDKRSGKQGSSGRLAGVGVLAVAACLVFVLSPRADVKHFSDLSVPSASDIDVQVGPQPEPLTPSGPELVAMPQSEGLAIDSSENELLIRSESELPDVHPDGAQHAEEADPSGNGGQNTFSVSLTRHSFPVSSVGDIVYYRSAYFGTVHVGSPAVPFKVVFDTGSGHLILPSTYCQSETCRVHRRYRRSESRTAKDIDYDGTQVLPGQPRDQITVSFGTGEVTGVFIEDVVCMGGAQDPALGQQANSSLALRSSASAADGDELADGCVKLRLIAATQMSEEPFKAFQFDGVLGLGLEGLSQAPEFNFLNVVANSRNTWGETPHTFAVFLAEHRTEESEITFGGWDDDSLMEDLSWNSVIEPEQGHWTIRIKQVRVDDEVVSLCDSGCKGVVDTGTSLLAVPAIAFSELYTLLRHPAHLEGHCHGPGPQLHIELEHFTITLDPEDYARVERSPAKRARPRFEAGKRKAQLTRSDMHCKPMLMSMDLPPPLGPKLFILGEPILRKFYSVYDAKKQRVGFARARHAPHYTPALKKDVNGNLYTPSSKAEPEFKSMFDVFRWRKMRKSGR